MSNWLIFPHSKPHLSVRLLFRILFLVFVSLTNVFIVFFPFTSPSNILFSLGFTSVMFNFHVIVTNICLWVTFCHFCCLFSFSSLFVSVLLCPAVCLSCAFSELGCLLQIWRLKPSWKSRSLSWKSPVWNVSIWLFKSSSTHSGSAPTRYCSTPAWPQGGFQWGGHTTPETNRQCFQPKAQRES